jgi:hypothetical protein
MDERQKEQKGLRLPKKVVLFGKESREEITEACFLKMGTEGSRGREREKKGERTKWVKWQQGVVMGL